MREFLRDNPQLKFSIIITISAIIPMLYLAVVGIIRGLYLATAVCCVAAAVLAASDIIMISRRYKQYKLRTSCVISRCDAVDEYKGCFIPGGDTMTDHGRKLLARHVHRHHSSFCAGIGMYTNCIGITCSQCILASPNRNKLIEWLKLKTNESKENETMEEYKGLKVPKMETEELKRFWRNVNDNRNCSCQSFSIYCGGLNCRNCIWSCKNSDKRYDYLKSIFEKEEGEKEAMKETKTIEEFLRPGVLFKTEIGAWYMNIRGKYAYHVSLVNDDCIQLGTAEIINPKDIIEAYDIDESIAGVPADEPLFCITVATIIRGRTLTADVKVWKRPNPVKEMTMADLAKHFGCEVKIVKED